MKRRDFFTNTGCGALALFLARLGLKADVLLDDKTEEKKAMIVKMIMEKMGKTEEEAKAMVIKLEEMLPEVKEKCICKTCPTFVAEEENVGFCHPFISKSEIIIEERGCNCPQCPVYKMKEMKNGYYCTRKSEMEQEFAKQK